MFATLLWGLLIARYAAKQCCKRALRFLCSIPVAMAWASGLDRALLTFFIVGATVGGRLSVLQRLWSLRHPTSAQLAG